MAFLDGAGVTTLVRKLKDKFQEKLVSGTNIKTINNNSLLGSGDITIEGGGGGGINRITLYADSNVSPSNLYIDSGRETSLLDSVDYDYDEAWSILTTADIVDVIGLDDFIFRPVSLRYDSVEPEIRLYFIRSTPWSPAQTISFSFSIY